MKMAILAGTALFLFCMSLPFILHAQGSSAVQGLPGFLSSATTGSKACPNGQATCWLPFTTTNPVPTIGVSP